MKSKLMQSNETKPKIQNQKSTKKYKEPAGKGSKPEKNETVAKVQAKNPTTKQTASEKKNFVPCQRLLTLFASDRKIYHECQKREQVFPDKVKKVAKKKTQCQGMWKNKNLADKAGIDVTRSSDGNKVESSQTQKKEPKAVDTIHSEEVLVMSYKDRRDMAGNPEPNPKDSKIIQTKKSIDNLTPDLLDLVNKGILMVSSLTNKQQTVDSLNTRSEVFDSSSGSIPQSDLSQNNFDECEKAMEQSLKTCSDTVKYNKQGDWNLTAEEASSGDKTKSEGSQTYTIQDCSIFVSKTTSSSSNNSRKLKTYEIKIRCHSKNLRSTLLKKVIKLIKNNGKTLKNKSDKCERALELKSVEQLIPVKSLVSRDQSRGSEELIFFDAEDRWPDNPGQEPPTENKQKSPEIEQNLHAANNNEG